MVNSELTHPHRHAMPAAILLGLSYHNLLPESRHGISVDRMVLRRAVPAPHLADRVADDIEGRALR